MPNTAIVTGFIPRIVIYLFLFGLIVLVNLTDNEGDYTIATLPLSDI